MMQALAELIEVGLCLLQLCDLRRLEQGAHLLFKLITEAAQLLLTCAAAGLQLLPLGRLRQAIALTAEQLGRAAEKATVGQQLLQGAAGLGQGGIGSAAPADTEVALFDLLLGAQQLAALGGL